MTELERIVEIIRATGEFNISTQPASGDVTCRLRDHTGATIYVKADGREFHIRAQVLERPCFPNHVRLHDYIRRHGQLKQWKDPTYVLDPMHIGAVLHIIVEEGPAALRYKRAVIDLVKAIGRGSNLTGTDFDDARAFEVTRRNFEQQPGGEGVHLSLSISWHAIGKLDGPAHRALEVLFPED